ncbi:MAG TPA: hypothetical protein VMG34_12010 [Bacteroidota bacterium]|nr:hypothetical protein [Bacteroidota bacterium]
MDHLLSVFLAPAIWVIKSLTYLALFRIRKIPATVISCFIIGGASYFLALIPIPIPAFVAAPLAIGLAIALAMHFNEMELIPDGLFIPLGIEVFYRVALWASQEAAFIQ